MTFSGCVFFSEKIMDVLMFFINRDGFALAFKYMFENFNCKLDS